MSEESTTTDVPMPQRVLVTGADGRIGSALTARLLQLGVEVTGLSPTWRAPARFRAITGDMTSEADVIRAMDGVDAVVHLGALANPSLGTPLEVYRTNVVGTFNVLAQAGKRGVERAVIASSINATGLPFNRHPVVPAYFPIDEELPHHHDDAYSLSKRSDELTAHMAASRWDMTIVALRYPLVIDREEVPGIGCGAGEQQMREGWSYLLVEDAVEAAIRGLVAPLRGAHVFALAASETYMDTDTEVLLDRYAPDVPRRHPIPGRSVAVDTSRARDLLGFSPRG
jgi:nucleoside-diphosphate-sugar epimerase